MPIPFLVRRRSTWYLRVRVPERLSPLLGTHLVRSTRTGRLADARRVIPTLLARYNAIWGVIRGMMDEAETDPADGPIPYHEVTGGHWRERMRRMDELYEAGESAGITLTREEVFEFVLDFDPAEQAARRQAELIADALARASIRLLSAQEAGSEADARRVLAAPTVPSQRSARPPSPTSLAKPEDPRLRKRLTELEETYYKDRGLGDSTRASHKTAFREFEALTSGKAIGDITAADIATYKEWLSKKPGRRGRESAAHASVEKSLNHVRAFLRWAVEDAGILESNPGQNVRPPNLFEIGAGKTMSAAARGGAKKTPFLRTSNVLWDEIDLSTVDEMTIPPHELAEKSLRAGDLLVCEGGEIGRAAVFEGEVGGLSFQNHLHRLRPLVSDIEPRFYVYFLQSAFTQLGLFEGAGNKTTIPNLSRNRLASLEVPHPPLPEQQSLAGALAHVREATRTHARAIKLTEELKRATMRKLFTSGLQNETQKESEIGPVPASWKVVEFAALRERLQYGTSSPCTYERTRHPVLSDRLRMVVLGWAGVIQTRDVDPRDAPPDGRGCPQDEALPV